MVFMSKPTLPARRIIELDLLRGFFIVVIILDHLQFWPSPLQYFTGQGRLWVSAAEGFFLISGLLIGYLRAYKGAGEPLKDLSIKLWKRAGMLWLWCVIVTLIVLALSVYLPGSNALLPELPTADLAPSQTALIWNIVTMNYASDWIYFLRLYAIMLALTPVFVWFIRQKQVFAFFTLMAVSYVVSVVFGFSEAALQWQVLYFGAALIGWKLETILAWFAARPSLRAATIFGLITVTLATMVFSYFMVHGWAYVESSTTSISLDTYLSIRSNVDPVFSNNPMALPRILLSFVWFGGLLALFYVGKKWIERYLGWLLLDFGRASLSVYCLQAIVLVVVLKLIQPTGNFWLNAVVGLAILVLIWGLLKIPLLNKILPK